MSVIAYCRKEKLTVYGRLGAQVGKAHELPDWATEFAGEPALRGVRQHGGRIQSEMALPVCFVRHPSLFV
jgi:hypothetical protein